MKAPKTLIWWAILLILIGISSLLLPLWDKQLLLFKHLDQAAQPFGVLFLGVGITLLIYRIILRLRNSKTKD